MVFHFNAPLESARFPLNGPTETLIQHLAVLTDDLDTLHIAHGDDRAAGALLVDDLTLGVQDGEVLIRPALMVSISFPVPPL